MARWLAGRRPAAAIVLGSGLGRLGERLAERRKLPYREIPGFPAPGVEGHAGMLVAGTLNGRAVLCQGGRFHAYEGYPAELLALPVRLFATLGIRTLLLTNAAGGIRRALPPGSLMLIADQINFTFRNPLIGPARPGEERFPDMSAPYDVELAGWARAAARDAKLPLEAGVYAGVAGPSYETPAEIRMLARMGADAVGMSTVLEGVTARALGMRVLGVSVITNHAAGISPAPLSHAEVTAAAAAAGERLEGLIGGVVARL